jgi:hypothetical protein
MALLAGLGLTGLAATSSIIHRRVPDIGQASDRWRLHPRCGAALPAGLFDPVREPAFSGSIIGKYYQFDTPQIRINFEQTSASLC